MLNLTYSFLQFSEGCGPVASECFENQYVYCFKSGDVIEMQFGIDNPLAMNLVDADNNVIANDIAVFTLIQTGFQKAVITLPTLELDKCYKLQIVEDYSEFCSLDDVCADGDICALGVAQRTYCSQKFKAIENTCFTEIIRYTNDESAFGFAYDTGARQQIRLAIELRFPQAKNTREIYKKTNGEIVVLSVGSDKEFELNTDYADEHFHEALNIALLHDTFEVVEGRRAGQYIGGGDYEIVYFEGYELRDIGKATTTVTLSPYDVLNPKFS